MDATFLFTDIEGSVALWERYPDEMAAAYIALERTVYRQAQRNKGQVYKVIGDAYQLVFSHALDAISAAIAMQREFSSHRWPTPHPMRVRMALHIAMVGRSDNGDYRSSQLNRIGRLIAAAHGGQMLLSETLAKAISPDLPDGVGTLNLGRFLLRGFSEREDVFQLVADGLPERFPPLSIDDRPLSNLLPAVTPLIGREQDLKAVRALLGSNRSRLVTLTGTGGVGKTRLARAVAIALLEDDLEGAYMVDLAHLREPEHLLPAIAETIGVRASGSASTEEAVVQALKERRWLLLLDNFEQIVEAAPIVAGLLASCPDLLLLVTSREALRINAEQLYAVEPLPIPRPPAGEDLSAFTAIPSVNLFQERARSVRSDFSIDPESAPDVAGICAMLEGLPLAIELAAARVGVLSIAEIRRRLARSRDLLTHGPRDAPRRHQTLRSTIEWSYDLLNADEQRALRALAVFAGGFTLEAVEDAKLLGPQAGSAFDEIASFIDRSLVHRVSGVEHRDRFAMFESVRAYLLDQLFLNHEESDVRARHAAWCAGLDESSRSRTQEARIRLIERERDNLLSALEWAQQRENAPLALRLATTLATFWRLQGFLGEGRRLLESTLNADQAVAGAERLAALIEACALANAQGDYRQAIVWGSEGLAFAKKLNDRRGVATFTNSVASTKLNQGTIDDAEALFDESLALFRSLGDADQCAKVIGNLGAVAHYRGDLPAARMRYLESLEIHRTRGNSYDLVTSVLNLLMVMAPFPEQHEDALRLAEENLRRCQSLGDRQGEAYTLAAMGSMYEAQGDARRALAAHEASLALFQLVDDRSGIGRALGNLGATLLLSGDLVRAATHFRQSLAIFVELDETDSVAYLLEHLSHIGSMLGAPVDAARILGAADALRASIETPLPIESVARYDQTISMLRETIGNTRFARERTRGRSLPIEQALKIANVFPLTESEAQR